eukprot:m.6233 g.6233  ORF g.6233 m.6233 type:complete len:834 (+) comp3813_c0_seq1:365-2866(+)
MSGDFALAATSAAVSQILAQHGFHMAEPTAVDLLGEVALEYAGMIATLASENAEHVGRTVGSADDIHAAVMEVAPPSLEHLSAYARRRSVAKAKMMSFPMFPIKSKAVATTLHDMSDYGKGVRLSAQARDTSSGTDDKPGGLESGSPKPPPASIDPESAGIASANASGTDIGGAKTSINQPSLSADFNINPPNSGGVAQPASTSFPRAIRPIELERDFRDLRHPATPRRKQTHEPKEQAIKMTLNSKYKDANKWRRDEKRSNPIKLQINLSTTPGLAAGRNKKARRDESSATAAPSAGGPAVTADDLSEPRPGSKRKAAMSPTSSAHAEKKRQVVKVADLPPPSSSSVAAAHPKTTTRPPPSSAPNISLKLAPKPTTAVHAVPNRADADPRPIIPRPTKAPPPPHAPVVPTPSRESPLPGRYNHASEINIPPESSISPVKKKKAKKEKKEKKSKKEKETKDKLPPPTPAALAASAEVQPPTRKLSIKFTISKPAPPPSALPTPAAMPAPVHKPKVEKPKQSKDNGKQPKAQKIPKSIPTSLSKAQTQSHSAVPTTPFPMPAVPAVPLPPMASLPGSKPPPPVPNTPYSRDIRGMKLTGRKLHGFPEKHTFKGNQSEFYCVCGLSEDYSAMVACDACDDWYHFVCLGYPDLQEAWEGEGRHFYCPKCLSKMPNELPQMDWAWKATDVKTAQAVLREIKKQRKDLYDFFYHLDDLKVDMTMGGQSIYDKTIALPMSIEVVEKKLSGQWYPRKGKEANRYPTLRAFHADMIRIVDNCRIHWAAANNPAEKHGEAQSYRQNADSFENLYFNILHQKFPHHYRDLYYAAKGAPPRPVF